MKAFPIGEGMDMGVSDPGPLVPILNQAALVPEKTTSEEHYPSAYTSCFVMATPVTWLML